MTRDDINNLIGETVMVEFRSGNVTRGKLGFTKEFSEKYGWRKPNYYTINEYDFLASHIKSIKEV